MKLEQQVCGLPVAKRLKELGVKQESLYFWCKDSLFSRDSMYHSESETHSAFTVAELGDITGIVARSYKTDKGWQSAAYWTSMVPYEDSGVLHPLYGMYSEDAETEANARAKMLIYLIENNLISL